MTWSWTLNLADYKVMRQLLQMMLVCHPTCLGSMVSNPDRTSDIICELEFSRLQRMKKYIEPDNLCPMKTPKVIEETLRTDVIKSNLSDHYLTLTSYPKWKVRREKVTITKRWFTQDSYTHIKELLAAES